MSQNPLELRRLKMPKLITFLSGLAMFLIGASSYFIGIPLFVECKSLICKIGSSVITVDLVMIGFGLLLIFISKMILKSET